MKMKEAFVKYAVPAIAGAAVAAAYDASMNRGEAIISSMAIGAAAFTAVAAGAYWLNDWVASELSDGGQNLENLTPEQRRDAMTPVNAAG